MNNNITIFLAAAMTVASACAKPTPNHARTAPRHRTETHASHREPSRTRPSFAPPNDPFHDIYRRNAGLLADKAPAYGANIHAKISAAEAAAKKRAAEAARAREPVNVAYSNCDAILGRTSPEEKSVVVVNKQINISDSSTLVVN